VYKANECPSLSCAIDENVLAEANIFSGEKVLQEKWLQKIEYVLVKANLKLPEMSSVTPSYGGRKGYHTEFLQPMLGEMSEVYSIDPKAEW